MKTTSRFAIAATASVLASSAMAADLGGNCCNDLEERVAELEATTARKGNRKVSLTVSGHINEALMVWDDGVESNAYIVSNNMSRTRFRFTGDAKINADWSAGYLLEIGVRYANSGNRNQGTNAAGGDTNTFDIRHSAWWMENKQLGRIWVGQTSTASDGITEINLANAHTGGSDPSGWQGGFFLRFAGGGLSSLKWNDVTSSQAGGWNVGEGDRNNVIRYVSPTFQGFTFSAAWGEDDQWDIALRYAGEFNGVRVAAGIGYREIRDNFGKNGGDGPRCADLLAAASQSAVDCNSLGLSGSLMHVPTGLYIHGSWGRLEDNNRSGVYFGVPVEDSEEHWYIQGGIQKNFFGIGNTTIFGEYGEYDAGARLAANGQLPGVGVEAFASANTRVWGIGVTQAIDAAAMDLYIGYKNFSVDVAAPVAGFGHVAVGAVRDFDAFVVGGIIRF